MKLILIKHSLPEIDPDVPANQWLLSSEGRGLCANLAIQLSGYEIDSVISSTEPKAVETGEMLAHSLGKPFRRVDGLHEHDRGDVGYLHRAEDFNRAVHSLFDKPAELVFGRETADVAHQRFSDAIDSVLETYEGRGLAVVAHGTVISLYVARKTGADPFTMWKRLDTPSYIVIDLPEFQIVKVVGSVEKLA